MNLWRNVLQGAMGGLIGGACLGLVEAIFHLTQSVPDLMGPLYGWVLYGLIGLPLGVVGGLVFTGIEKARDFKDTGALWAFQLGAVAAIVPLGAFTLRYLLNKIVYAEAGLGATGNGILVAAVVIYVVVELTLGNMLVNGPGKFLLKGPGAIGTFVAGALITGAVSMAPVGEDPRANFAVNKPASEALKDKPNVLFLTVDTLRADYLGHYGADHGRTPVLDAFAADSIVFERNYAQASWTRSSFAALWSSQIPSAHNTDTKASMMPSGLDLLSEVVHNEGVVTANLANNINVTKTFGFDQGYDVFVYESPDYAFGATEGVFSLTWYKVVHKVAEKLGGKLGLGKEVNTFYQPAEVVLADAQAFISANKDARWMLGVHLMEPHDPYFEHPYIDGSGDAEFNGKGFARAEVEHPKMEDAEYLKGVYLDEIDHMDRKLKPFFEWLKAEGMYDNTVIILTADHGEEFGEHGGFWHGQTLYNEQTHVPLVIKLPKSDRKGTRVGWPVRSIDVAPTVTALLGIKPSDQWTGSDLLADLTTQDAAKELLQSKLDSAQAAVDAIEALPNADEAVLAPLKEQLEGLQASVDDCAAYGIGADTEDEVARAKQQIAGHVFGRTVVSEQDFEGNVLQTILKDGQKVHLANEGNPRGLPTEMLFNNVTDANETKNLAGEGVSLCAGVYDNSAELKENLKLILQAAERSRVEGPGGPGPETTEKERRNLCALGYLSGPQCD